MYNCYNTFEIIIGSYEAVLGLYASVSIIVWLSVGRTTYTNLLTIIGLHSLFIWINIYDNYTRIILGHSSLISELPTVTEFRGSSLHRTPPLLQSVIASATQKTSLFKKKKICANLLYGKKSEYKNKIYSIQNEIFYFFDPTSS